ncbi:3-oxoadipate enol-lactonase [Paracoccus contaminans]|uniref:3-oxoadipate enol-lactonase n=1 Tax=Paracoccus contaminans TaxID=1945662 RepID=A0A1W6CWT5_9RHOB|nr:3-oxoadipate enol-lactonase [Paracoccus contaminans]ARJ69316.1 3-oxoadipate enol-lactonase [Paracoccus contaminans]
MLTATVNNVNLHYALSGPKDGPAVVFANSLGTDLRLWDELLALLPAGLRVLRYDKRGHGLSEETPGPCSIELLADDAAALIEHLGLGPAVFVGLSIGGLIGQALALRRPELLAGLVISNSAAKLGDAASWQDRIDRVQQGGLPAIAEATMERWFSPDFRAGGSDRLWARMLARQPAGGYGALCRALAAADLRGAVPALRLPVQVIAGAHDGAAPPEIVRATAGLIPGARFALIEDAAHIPCVETPAEYAAIITRFLEEIGHVR